MTDGTWNRKGMFSFPNNIRSLIDWFLDPDLRRARQRVVNRIENSTMTEPAKALGRAVVGVQALQIQAKRNRRSNVNDQMQGQKQGNRDVQKVRK